MSGFEPTFQITVPISIETKEFQPLLQFELELKIAQGWEEAHPVAQYRQR